MKNIDYLPREVMIEVEPKCNFNCRFCFNKISFAKNGRNIAPLGADYVKKIIRGIAKTGIKIVRFTGGEPMLRNDIFELMKYAKSGGLEVRLNTNGSLITSDVARKLKGIADNALIPIESYRVEDEASATGNPDALIKKINAVKFLKKAKIPTVRVGTVALRKNILDLEKLAKFILRLPADEWELYRPITIKKGIGGINKKDANLLVNKLNKIKNKTKKPVSIANAFPFCAAKNLNKANNVCSGAFYDDGNSRLVIDARGFVKPHYFINKNIGNPLNILDAWRHPFMKKMRNLQYLPKKCAKCYFKFKCRGGSRYEAKRAFNSFYALDPLARLGSKRL